MKKIVGVTALLVVQAATLGVIWANETGKLDKNNSTFIGEAISNVSQMFEGEEKNSEEADAIGVALDIKVVNGKVQLDVTDKSENGVVSGVMGDIPFFYYEGLEEYVYINGDIYKLTGTLNGNVYEVDVNEFKKALGLIESENKYYYREDNQIAKVRNFELTSDEIEGIIKNPNIPLEGANVTKEEGQLPGAARTYRNGHHEGFDWYAEAIGAEVTKETEVKPIYAGEIVRIDKKYIEMEMHYREALLAEAGKQKNTSPETLDKLRGRQIWVQSENGVLVRYAHLSSVSDNLRIGDSVTLDTVIGTVGNSGTSNGALNTDLDLHLHSDILIYGKNFWEYGDVKTLNQMVVGIFDKVKEEQQKIIE